MESTLVGLQDVVNVCNPELMSVGLSLDLSQETQNLLQTEEQFIVGGFLPLPAFIARGEGATLWDINGKEYIDFISMFSAVNQGHSHSKILAAVFEQARQVSLVNLASHSNKWPPFAKMLCQRFGYDKITAMVTGAEAVDAACKIARKWGCEKKRIPAEKTIILAIAGNYHGLTSNIWSLASPSLERSRYGLKRSDQFSLDPSGDVPIRYGHTEDIKNCLEKYGGCVAAVIMECIRNELLTFREEIEYARGVYDLCKNLGILFIADEVKMGMAKTGKFFSFQHLGSDCKPDLVVIGKSITGGVYPASFVLGTDETMTLVGPYESASTFAAAPLGIAAAEAAIGVIDDENLLERASKIGTYFEKVVTSWRHEHVQRVSTRGADLRIWIKEQHPSGKVSARRVCALCMHFGVLMYPKFNVMRMSPPLVIKDAEMGIALSVIKKALDSVTEYETIAGER